MRMRIPPRGGLGATLILGDLSVRACTSAKSCWT